ncbi:MAG: thiamine phosphate synthase [Caulobacteraceae bacterium]
MPPACRLYLITPPAIADLEEFADEVARVLREADVAALQVRLKPANEGRIAETVERVRPILAGHGVALILNDRPDLAAALDCDGVHIGQADGSVAAARRVIGPGRILGVSCQASRHLAMEAAETGADYVAFGAFYPTATKQSTSRADPEMLSIWQECTQIPCVAIGGITPENCRPLVAAGADFLAVSAGVWGHPDGSVAGARALCAKIAQTLAEPGSGGSGVRLASPRGLH